MARSAVGKFIRLPWQERLLLVRSVLTLATVRVAIWVLPFRAARRLMVGRRRPTPSGVTREQVRWAISVAQRVVPAATCLPQAVAAEALLARAGHPAELRIGVMKTPAGKLDAHAWVESDGRIVVGELPGGLDRYKPLPTLPSAWPQSPATRAT